MALTLGDRLRADELIVNGDFESGALAPWQLVNTALIGNADPVIEVNDGAVPFAPRAATTPPCEGTFSALMHQKRASIQSLSQTVVMPDDLKSATLSWTDQILNRNALVGGCGGFLGVGFLPQIQEYRVMLKDTQGNVLTTLYKTDPADPVLLKGCENRSFDVTGFANQTIEVVFEQENQVCFQSIQIDKVSLEFEKNPQRFNSAPTVSSVADQTLFGTSIVGPLRFEVSDKETNPSLLVLSARSNNQSVVSNQNILLGGAGSARTISITGVSGFGESAVVTVRVVDESGNSGTSSFTVTSFAGNSVVVDNSDPTFSTTGTWAKSGTVDGYLGSSLYSAASGGAASFRPEGLEAGRYQIFAWWANRLASGRSVIRSSQVAFRVDHAGMSDSLVVDQTKNSGQWVELGVFEFVGAVGEGVTIDLGQSFASDSVSADAVAFVAVSGGGGSRDVVVDNLSPGFLALGDWTESGATDEFEGQSLATFTAGASAIWSPELEISGSYDVYVWVPRLIRDGRFIDRAKAVKYVVAHRGGTSIRVVDQDAAPSGTWSLIGNFPFDGQAGESVTLLASSASFGQGSAAADAVRFLLRDDEAATDFIVDNMDEGFSAQGTWLESSAVDEFAGSSIFSRNSGDRARWQFPDTEAGRFQVFIWNSAALTGGRVINRSASVKLLIEHNGITSSILVDQNLRPGEWVSIGEFEFNGDGTENVSLIASGISTVADAVRFLKIQ